MKIPEYLDWLREQPDQISYTPPRNDPHHCGRFGTAKRNHDEVCVSLNRVNHQLAEDNKIDRDMLIQKAQHQFNCWLETLSIEKKLKILQDLANENKM